MDPFPTRKKARPGFIRIRAGFSYLKIYSSIESWSQSLGRRASDAAMRR